MNKEKMKAKCEAWIKEGMGACRGVGKSLLFKAVYGGALTDNELRAIPKELRDAIGLRGPTFKGNK